MAWECENIFGVPGFGGEGCGLVGEGFVLLMVRVGIVCPGVAKCYSVAA